MSDKINNKISEINDANKMLENIKVKLKKKIESIYKSMFKLQRAIYKNDSRLRLAELNKMDAIIDNALNVILNIIGLNKIIID